MTILIIWLVTGQMVTSEVSIDSCRRNIAAAHASMLRTGEPPSLDVELRDGTEIRTAIMRMSCAGEEFQITEGAGS